LEQIGDLYNAVFLRSKGWCGVVFPRSLVRYVIKPKLIDFDAFEDLGGLGSAALEEILA